MKRPANNPIPNTVFKWSKRMIAVVLLFPLFFSSCDEQRIQVMTWTEYEPVYMSEEAFKNAVKTEAPRNLEKPGKIYIYKNYLFVNEVNDGLHIIDNSDPAAPENIGFINIPANKDLAIHNELLYADSERDLLVFDISNIEEPELLSRKAGVFEFSATKQLSYPYQEVDPSKGIVVDWKPVSMKEVCEFNCGGQTPRGSFFSVLSSSSSGDGATGGVAVTGTGGSMARFTITGNHLYAVDDRNLLAFDISSPEPVNTYNNNVGWDIETIFPYQNYLFIGSASAMYIYDISNPNTPDEASVYSHFTACDPVVVQNDIAYVTLRNGDNRCPRGVNRLEVIDVEDPRNPREIKFYEMKNPHGLGIDGNYLFVSEGESGIKIMDAENPNAIKLLRHITNIQSFDVIPFNNVLMVTGSSGIVQYDYSNIDDVRHLSTIPVVDQEL